MQAITKILVKIEKQFVDELDFNGGKIWFDSSYRPEWNAFPYGEVVAIPARNPKIADDFVHNVQVGDKLYFNFGVVMDESNRLLYEEEEYWVVDYFMALAVVRDGKIIPVGEHILIEPIEEEVKSSSIIIPELARKRMTTNGVVFASNDDQIPEGSTVMFEERGMFENTIEGKKLFVMFNENILGVLKH